MHGDLRIDLFIEHPLDGSAFVRVQSGLGNCVQMVDDFLHLGDVVPQHRLDSALQRVGGAVELENDAAPLEPAKDDVATLVPGDGPDPRLQQFLDLSDHFVVAIGGGGGRVSRIRRFVEKDRTLGHEVVHDDAQDRRFEQCPVLAVVFGQRDRIRAEIRPAQLADLE